MEQANSIGQYLKILDRYRTHYDEIYYRGQSEKYKDMPPSISRDVGYLQNEGHIFHESINMKNDEFQALSHPFEKLSKLQHYGIPTRLVDVTVDPLIALFFAVQNTEGKYAGNIYVYLAEGCDFNDERVKALSLLATLQDYDLQTVCRQYEQQYGSSITYERFLSLIEKPVFIKHCEELKESNSRLYNQKGAFVICGNVIENNIIIQQLKSLDTLKPSLIIRIPYEYKALIKEQLDKNYGINELEIYPELPSVADYIKAKYKKDNFSSDGTYSLMETHDVSIGGVKRVSLVITLKVLLTIFQIRKVAFELIDQYKSRYDVIRIYIAKNGEDYIMRNWVLRGQWINPELDKMHRPLPLKIKEGNGYYWEENKSYSTLNDFYSENIFEDDKVLYVCHQKIYNEILSIYKELLAVNQKSSLDNFIEVVNQHRNKLSDAYRQLGEFGHSRNIEFDKFLRKYHNAVGMLDNLSFWIVNDNLSDIQLQYKIKLCLKGAKKDIDIIETKNKQWRDVFSVTDNDFASIDPYNRPKIEYQFVQTIPISPNAIIVYFETTVCENKDGTFRIVGRTNLFNFASLMLSVSNTDNKLLRHSKTTVMDGKFEFEKMSINGAGRYNAEISLSVPSVQQDAFTKLAGLEYENLTGPLVDRTGIGPSVKYNFTFEIV